MQKQVKVASVKFSVQPKLEQAMMQAVFQQNPDYQVGVGLVFGQPAVVVPGPDGWEATIYRSIGEAIQRAQDLGWDPVAAGIPQVDVN